MTTHIVKSGGRSLEVMEFFADCREAGVMEVSRALGYPQSSTSELLGSLAALGYLRYDPQRRTFSAGARAAVLGATLSARVFGGNDLSHLVDAVASELRRDAHLCDVVGGRVHYLVDSTVRNTPRAPAGLSHSAAGLLFLAAMPDAEAARLVAREEERAMAAPPLSAQLAQVRRDGFALRACAGGAELGVSLNRQPGAALCLAGSDFGDRDQAAAAVRRVRTIVRRWRDPEVRQAACNA
ncbi:MAG: helix-turn-helix domain-containing protein [Hyphomonadaceae bacterium]